MNIETANCKKRCFIAEKKCLLFEIEKYDFLALYLLKRFLYI